MPPPHRNCRRCHDSKPGFAANMEPPQSPAPPPDATARSTHPWAPRTATRASARRAPEDKIHPAIPVIAPKIADQIPPASKRAAPHPIDTPPGIMQIE
jgi:hypothetical protein